MNEQRTVEEQLPKWVEDWVPPILIFPAVILAFLLQGFLPGKWTGFWND
jgi:hypothetical protein